MLGDLLPVTVTVTVTETGEGSSCAHWLHLFARIIDPLIGFLRAE